MGAIAFVFPGQGSQYVGMARDLYESDDTARAMMDRADSVVGFPLSRICFEGPEDELRQTSITQPAIFLHSMLIAGKLTAIRPDMVAGHSLGEYSALVIAGAILFEDALRLVRLRGELMQQAGEAQRGTMAAVVGLPATTVEEICREASTAGIVQPANFNSPGQIVISGSVEGVRNAMNRAREQGAKLVRELVVSGAFHSPLMEMAQVGLQKALASTTIANASIPVYANVTGAPVTTAGEIRTLLYQQLTHPVLWEQSVQNMIKDGATRFLELGPGKVLQGLVRRIDKSVEVGGYDTVSDLQTVS